MFNSGKRKIFPSYLLNYAISLAVIWTIIIAAFLIYDLRQIDKEVFTSARAYAEVGFNKDVVYRRWAAMHEGIYVPVTEKTLPNPNLSHIPDRDITTPSGKKLTLMNPAYMTRQIFELEAEEQGIKGHITSLSPVHPENKADEWETKALNAFETGVKEVVSIEKLGGEKYLRVMKPFITEKGCLKCHAIQGYKLNDIRGGISVSIPFDKMLILSDHSKIQHAFVFIFLWAIGFIAIGFGYIRLHKNESKRFEAERALEASHNDLENKVRERTQELSKVNKEHEELEKIINKSNSIVFLWQASEGWSVEYVSDNISLFGYLPIEFYSKKVSYIDLIHPDDVERVGKEVKFHSENGANEFTQEYRVITKSGDICFTSDFTWIQRNENGQITHYQGLVVDVTEEKKAQANITRLSRLFEESLNEIYLFKEDTLKFTQVNNAALKNLGYSTEEILQLTAPDLKPELTTEAFVKMIKPLREGKTKKIVFETVHERKDQSHYNVEIHLQLMRYENESLFAAITLDITERKQAEQVLNESEKRFRLLYENAPLSYQSLDADGCFIDINPTWMDTLGYKREDVIGKRFREFMTLESAELVKSRFSRFKAEGEIHGVEFEMVRKDGSKIYVSFDGRIGKDEYGNFKQTHCIFSDITKRKQVEGALDEALVFNKTMLETSPDLIYVYDIIDRKNIYINQGIMKILGYSIEEIQKMGENVLLTLMHPDDFDNYLKEIIPRYQTARDGESIQHEYRMKHKDGTWKWLQSKESIFMRLDDGMPKQIFGLTADITERKRTEKLLIHSHDLMSYVIEHSNSAVAVHDKDMNYLYVSKNYLKQYKIEEKDVIGKHHYEVFPDLPQKWRDVHQKALAGEISSADDDPYYKEDGTVDWTRWECRPWHKADSSIGGIIVYTEVITERKEMELALHKAHDELEIKVDERTKELSLANIRLQELDRLKSMFIASMSHELRTPLNSIIGFTGILLQGISGKIDVEAREDLSIVYNSSKHLLSLINDVIDISKIEADKFDTHFEDVKLDDVIEEIISTVSKDAENKKLKIKTEFPNGLIIHSDRRRLFQCILNLMSNAVKFTEKGVIKLKIEKTADVLKINVTDSGIGIKKEDIPKLFKSFIRLETPMKEVTPGTGLGLYLTQKIVTNVFQGETAVESEHGKGSTFTLKIPLKTEV